MNNEKFSTVIVPKTGWFDINLREVWQYRDLVMLISFGVQLWMYATPVAYDISIIPQAYMGLYMLNPVTPIINMFRYGFLGVGTPCVVEYAISWVTTLVVLFIGVMLFNRVEKTFMDTV